RRRPRRAVLFANDVDWGNEPIAALRQRLDEARVFGRIAQSLTEPVDGGIEAVIEVDERVSRPQTLPQLVASDDIAAALEQQDEDVERAAAQLHAAPLFHELARAAVNLEHPEPEAGARQIHLG